MLGCSEGFFVHTTSWEDSNHEGHPRLVLYGISLWSLQHSHFRVVRFLTCYFGIAKTYVPRERINQVKPKFFKDPSLKLTQPHFCHFLLAHWRATGLLLQSYRDSMRIPYPLSRVMGKVHTNTHRKNIYKWSDAFYSTCLHPKKIISYKKYFHFQRSEHSAISFSFCCRN